MQLLRNFFVIIAVIYSCIAQGQIIITVAGNGVLGFTGNGGPATAAEISPFMVRADTRGNFYINDDSSTIRKVDAAGIINIIAGNKTNIHSGDGGPATAAGLLNPSSVAIDKAGNLFIAEAGDSSGSWVRKVDTSGIITTIAGNGTITFSGDGGPALLAGLTVSDIAVDGIGNIYIGDANNCRIRKIDTAGIITTIAGNGICNYSGDGVPATTAGISPVEFMAADNAGNIYISDQAYNIVRKISTGGIITTIAGTLLTMGYSGDGGPATAAEFSFPTGVAVDKVGNVYIGDYDSHIRRVDTAGIISTYAGAGYGYYGDGGPATAADLTEPAGVTVDTSGALYFVDFNNQVVRKISPGSVTLSAPRLCEDEHAIKIWPEPNNGTFSVNISTGENEPVKLIITDIMGQKIKEVAALPNKSVQIKLDVPPGTYFITAGSGKDRQIAKMIVQ